MFSKSVPFVPSCWDASNDAKSFDLWPFHSRGVLASFACVATAWYKRDWFTEIVWDKLRLLGTPISLAQITRNKLRVNQLNSKTEVSTIQTSPYSDTINTRSCLCKFFLPSGSASQIGWRQRSRLFLGSCVISRVLTTCLVQRLSWIFAI